MSWRAKKKLYGETKLPTPDNSDDEFQPHYAKPLNESVFEKLSLSSPSESHQDSSTDKLEEEAACSSKSQKKKKKKKRNKLRSHNDASTSKNDNEQLDEIDRSVMEVNAILGSPPEPSASFQKAQKIAPLMELMSIEKKHLNAENEMKQFMGADTPKEERKKRQGAQGLRLYKRNIVTGPNNPHSFLENGMSMSIVRRDGDIIYFTYDHGERYQALYKHFLGVVKKKNLDLLATHIPIQNFQLIEGMIEVVDFFILMEEYDKAEAVLKRIIICLQCAAHPYFNFTNPNVRLEYKYVENRPFFTTLLRYIYLLSNMSCNRTALELCKLLLNLDPSDPLKMFLVVDLVALRGHEHKWLVDVLEAMDWGHRNTSFLLSLRYSYALAKFYVVTKQNDSTYDIDKLLQDTILMCPFIAKGLLNSIPRLSKEELRRCLSHTLFMDLAENHIEGKLRELTSFYVRMVRPRWWKPKVVKWLLKNVNHLIATFSPEMEATVIKNMNEQSSLFRTWPSEIIRHLTVIKAMDELLSEGALPRVRSGPGANPVPPLGTVDRYGYCAIDAPTTAATNSLWLEFFTSILTRDQNTNFMGLNWLLARNVRENFFDSDLYYNHIDGIPYMVAPCTFTLMSLYFTILSFALRAIRLGAYNEPEKPPTFFDNVELD